MYQSIENKKHKKKRIPAILSAVLLSLSAAGSTYAANENSLAADETSAAEQEEAKGYWSEQGGVWYYYDAAGNPVQGWIEENGSYYYLTENGSRLVSGITPDGFFVDADGRWYSRKTTIFNQEFTAPSQFPASYSAWGNTEQLSFLRSQLRLVFKERRLKISDNAIEYVVSSDQKERVLLGLYRKNETGSFRLDLGVSLDAGSTELNDPETYDYMIFRAMLYEMTSTPDYLEKAIYSSWEESNSWKINRETPVQIGDALVKYDAASGYGRYQVSPVQR